MNIIRKHLILAVALAFLAVAGTLVAPLHEEQIRSDLTSDPVAGLGPDMVLFTTALGAFRGIAINVIWIRMESLKREGRFFEIAQLADLACRLAPRFPKVWDYNAWNMAYNITPQLPVEDRWPWVRQGIELLRDQAIPVNPEEPELYFSLAYKYMHKVGGDIDDAHFYYKQRLGEKMHEVLGGSGSPEVLKALANAPGRRDVLLQDEEVREFYESLIAVGFDPLREGDGGGMQIFRYLHNPGLAPEDAVKLMEADANRDIMDQIVAFARAFILRENLKLTPEVMLDMMDRYGPLDWRNPFSHAIYWANLGGRVAAAYRDRDRRRRLRAGGMSVEELLDVDLDEEDVPDWGLHRYTDINYERIIYGSLQSLVRHGRLLFDDHGRLLSVAGPDYRFTEPMIEMCEMLLGKYDDADAHFSGIKRLYESFLVRAAVEFFFMGAEEDSRRYYELLGERFPRERYDTAHEEFVTAELSQYVERATVSDMRNIIRSFLNRSYLHLASYDDERAEALYERARHMTRLWNEETPEGEGWERHRVDFSRLRESVLSDIFDGLAGFPQELIDVLSRELPPQLVRRAGGTPPEDGEND